MSELSVFLIQLFAVIPIIYASTGGKKLGDECIPGMCSALNSNCKWNGSFFKCVCKEKFIAVNSTHCGHTISNIEEQKCRDCLERDSLCLDFDNDGLTDECWCPKNETCSKTKDSPRNGQKLAKNVDLSMVLMDPSNNRIISDGSTVQLGDQVLIDIKTNRKENGVALSIENCSVSALGGSEENYAEKTDLLKKGCPVQSDAYPIVSFHSLEDTHLESSTFEIIKPRSSSTVSLSCWVQLCWQKSKCPTHTCQEKLAAMNQRKKMTPNPRAMNSDSSAEYFTYKETTIRLNIEDPFGSQQLNENLRPTKNEITPNVIELDFKTKPFSGLVKSFIVSTITIIFAIIVSAVSILTYRACLRDQLMHSGVYDAPLSICQTSENSCKYDINGRNLEESFFQSNGDPLTAQSHNPRW